MPSVGVSAGVVLCVAELRCLRGAYFGGKACETKTTDSDNGDSVFGTTCDTLNLPESISAIREAAIHINLRHCLLIV